METKDIVVNSLGEYLAEVSKIRNQWDSYNPNTQRYFYRGQYSEKWGLIPYLFREDSSRTSGKLTEYNLLQQAASYCWKWIKDLKSYAERMVFFQHFGLPTRLLDVTTNPLIALYFACHSENPKTEDENECGVVYIGNKQPIDIYTIEFVSELVFTTPSLYIKESDVVDLFYKHLELKLSFGEICDKILMNPHFFYAPYNNNRINAQAGAFIMPPVYDRKWGMNNPYTLECIDYKRNLGESGPFSANRILIPSERKNAIYEELAVCGIHEASLFPDAEHMMKFVKRNPMSFDNVLNGCTLAF